MRRGPQQRPHAALLTVLRQSGRGVNIVAAHLAARLHHACRQHMHHCSRPAVYFVDQTGTRLKGIIEKIGNGPLGIAKADLPYIFELRLHAPAGQPDDSAAHYSVPFSTARYFSSMIAGW